MSELFMSVHWPLMSQVASHPKVSGSWEVWLFYLAFGGGGGGGGVTHSAF